MNISIKDALLILLAFVIYAGTGICSKYASMFEFLSCGYMLFFCGVVFLLAVYAVIWQKILSFMPLNKAYIFKSITIVIAMIYSRILFGEQITLANVIGVSVIISGIAVLSWKE